MKYILPDDLSDLYDYVAAGDIPIFTKTVDSISTGNYDYAFELNVKQPAAFLLI